MPREFRMVTGIDGRDYEVLVDERQQTALEKYETSSLTKDFEAFDQFMAEQIVGDPEDLPAHVVLHRAGWTVIGDGPDDQVRPVGPVVSVGIEAAGNGHADLCSHCGELRYRADMRWLVDVYWCRGCTGGAGSPPLMIDWGRSEQFSA